MSEIAKLYSVRHWMGDREVANTTANTFATAEDIALNALLRDYLTTAESRLEIWGIFGFAMNDTLLAVWTRAEVDAYRTPDSLDHAVTTMRMMKKAQEKLADKLMDELMAPIQELAKGPFWSTR